MARKQPLDVDALAARALESPAVREALRRRAEQLLPRAQRLAYTAGANSFAKSLRVEQGTRPGTKAKNGLQRPFARVVGDSTDEIARADAAAKLTRRQILRRAARG
ncbi:hypothetical protein [Serinibacter salmoneus]|uniref:Uncharacterized protein n=1 Tax=Serinibacter salmoneus TaxID=556530 RepID=A0A2A9D1P8_9MICO|nr:hypothetical protein [Serinibacter salmoneus]PFG19872.1 hypothetical protein ATL40_1448 [Serinibacter salmoneus]